jgi:glucan phosphorylase
VLDGWWAEGYREDAGWALSQNKTYNDQRIQDELDAEVLYDILENEIQPAFYVRDEHDVPGEWLKRMKNAIAYIAPQFTMRRMLNEYISRHYDKLFENSSQLKAGDFRAARDLAAWKRKVFNVWDMVSVHEYRLPDADKGALKLGDTFEAELDIDLNGLNAEDIGIEIIFGRKENDEVRDFIYHEELHLVKSEDGIATFGCKISATRAGVFDYAFRMYPQHEMLEYRQLFPLVKWL